MSKLQNSGLNLNLIESYEITEPHKYNIRYGKAKSYDVTWYGVKKNPKDIFYFICSFFPNDRIMDSDSGSVGEYLNKLVNDITTKGEQSVKFTEYNVYIDHFIVIPYDSNLSLEEHLPSLNIHFKNDNLEFCDNKLYRKKILTVNINKGFKRIYYSMKEEDIFKSDLMLIKDICSPKIIKDEFFN